jgi:hypothetical protein
MRIRRPTANAGAGFLVKWRCHDFGRQRMPTFIKHRNTRIVTLEQDETILQQCQAGDIAIVRDTNGWWTDFVGENGEVDRYDAPFDSYQKALWAAKAAAEFAGE